MRAGLNPIAVRFSLCVSFRSRIRGLQNIRVCRYWFVAVIGLRQRIRRIKARSCDSFRVRFLFASSADEPYN